MGLSLCRVVVVDCKQVFKNGALCVCTDLPYLCNPVEVLEVVTLRPRREMPKSSGAGVMQEESCPVPVC